MEQLIANWREGRATILAQIELFEGGARVLTNGVDATPEALTCLRHMLKEHDDLLELYDRPGTVIETA